MRRRAHRGGLRRAGPWAAALATLAVAIPAAAPGLAADGTGAAAPGAATAAAGEARTYADPKGRYVLAVPGDAKVEGGSGNLDLIIESRKGYRINVQSGKVNPKADLAALVGRLEARYLGPGRPWSAKRAGGPRTVAGLAAYDTLYDGGHTRVRVVIARGRVHDFVFMFFAAPNVYERLVDEFEWILGGFRPAAAEVPPAAAAAPPAAANAGTPSAAPGPPAAGADPGVRRFAAAGLGFAIDYPGDWVPARPSPFTVIFSGREGTDAYFATVSIRNVQAPAGEGGAAAVAAVIADLKAQIDAGATAVAYFGDGPLAYENGGLRLAGHQFLATYTRAGQRFRKWSVAVPRPAGGVVHVWSYTAPEPVFEVYRPLAEAMRKTWTITPGTP